MPRHKRNRSSPPKAAAELIAPPRPRVAIGLALVFLTTVLVYLPAMNGGRLWDDDAHITRAQLHSVGGLYRIWFQPGATQQYYPLLHSAFWLEHQLWGDSMLGYHVINVVWHLVAVTLVYLALSKLKIPGALLGAAIFAVHPVMVESVAWITEQKNTLSAVFYLSALLMYLRFDLSRRQTDYCLALVLFVLGLLTKTVTATLPAAILVIFWWERGKLSWRRDVLPLLPFFVVGAVAGLITAWVERTQIGAAGADFELNFLDRCVLAGRVIWFYLGKLIWPANLMFIYPRWTIDAAQAWQWIFSLAALALTVVFWVLHKRWRAPLACWLFFCGTLSPVLGFLNVYPFVFSFVADHFQYLASLGIIVLFASATARQIAHLAPAKRPVGMALSVLVVGVLAMLSWRQSHLYANSIELYQATLAQNPNSWMVHINLGAELAAKGDRQEAIRHFQTALRMRANNPEAHCGIGKELALSGHLPDAVAHLREAIRLAPTYLEAHHALGDALLNSGQFSEAIAEYRAILALTRSYPIPLNNFALALAQIGRTDEAIDYLKECLRVEPNHVEARNNLGVFLTHSGHATEAIPQLEYALRLRPNSADIHNNLADALRQVGKPNEAIEHCRSSLRLKPDYVPGYANLAKALADMNQTQEAIATAQHGIELGNSTQQTEVVNQIQEWLMEYRSKLKREKGVESAK